MSRIGNATKVARFFQGNALQAAGTYALFLALAHVAGSASVFGQFVVLVSIAGILPVIVDALSSQQLVRMLSNKPDSSSNEMKGFLRARLFLVVSIAALTMPFGLFMIHRVDEFIAFGAMYLGASASVVATTSLTFANDPRSFARGQLIVFIFTSALGVSIYLGINDAGVVQLLLAWGLVKALSAGVFSWCTVRSGQPQRQQPLVILLGHIMGAESKKHFFTLGSTHILNAFTAQVDTFIAASIGLAGAAKYQAAQRPVLALSVINVSVAQAEFADSIQRAKRSDARNKYLPFAAVLIWPALALAFGWLIYFVTPSNLRVDFAVFALLGLANGFGLLAAVSGPSLLVKNQSKGLLFSASGQLIVLTIAGLFFAQSFGVIGVAVSLSLAKGTSAAIQALWLRFYSAKP